MSSEILFYAYLTSFYQINDVRHLWPNLEKKYFECSDCKIWLQRLKKHTAVEVGYAAKEGEKDKYDSVALLRYVHYKS